MNNQRTMDQKGLLLEVKPATAAEQRLADQLSFLADRLSEALAAFAREEKASAIGFHLTVCARIDGVDIGAAVTDIGAEQVISMLKSQLVAMQDPAPGDALH